MKKNLLAFAMLMMASATFAQINFGGVQANDNKMEYSQKFADINYVGDDQAYHTLDIYLPKEEKASYPVVIHIYGSAWFSNNSKNMADLNTICAALLNAGYAVVTPNHRSSNDAKYPAQINDIRAVIRFVRGEAANYNLDPNFVGISGFSSGGHLASLALTTHGLKNGILNEENYDLEGSLGAHTNQSSDVDAACSWSGPIDLQNMDCGEGMKMPTSPEEVLIGVPMSEKPDKYALLSPIHYVDANDPPIMVFHGTEDNVVPYCQGERFAKALKDAGAKYQFNRVDGGGHGFNMYSEENLQKMVDFFNQARKNK